MPIKNYTTKIAAAQTMGEIQGILASHGARKVMMDFSESGDAEAVTFALMLNNRLVGFRLTAKPEGVIRVMKKEGQNCTKEQATRIAWRNIKDWISAQIALVETEQASMQEVFLPYLVISKGDTPPMTLYEQFEQQKYLPLES